MPMLIDTSLPSDFRSLSDLEEIRKILDSSKPPFSNMPNNFKNNSAKVRSILLLILNNLYK